MIFQPGSGGSGGLSIIASGAFGDSGSVTTVQFNRPAKICFVNQKVGSVSWVEAGGSGWIGTNLASAKQFNLSADGYTLSVQDIVTGGLNYLALG